MALTRRKFIAASVVGLPGGLLALRQGRLLGAAQSSVNPAGTPEGPWHQRIRRVGQVNFNERDPVELDVEAWADYWASAKVDAVLVSVTGILAFYPTRVPFHRRSRFLGDRDLFGACTRAAKKRGLRVVARLSPDLSGTMHVKAAPGMVHARRRRGVPCPRRGSPALSHLHVLELFHGAYPGDHARSPGATTSTGSSRTPGPRSTGCRSASATSAASWPSRSPSSTGTSSPSAPRNSGSSTTRSPRRRSPTASSSPTWARVRATPNLLRLGEVASGSTATTRGAGATATPYGALRSRAGSRRRHEGPHGHQRDRFLVATGAGYRWRNVAKSRAEAEIWMDQTVASGMTIWYHWVGGQKGHGRGPPLAGDRQAVHGVALPPRPAFRRRCAAWPISAS
jgi:hypothetical protein